MKYQTPKLEVAFEVDGETKEVQIQTTARDQFAFDMIRRNTKNFPSQTEAPALWCYILAWSALKREKIISATEWDWWIENSLLNANLIEDDSDNDPLAVK